MCLLLQGWKDSRLVRWLRKGLRRRRRNARRNQEVLRLRGSGHQRQGLFLLGGEKPGATAATAATAARTQSDPLGKTPNKAGSPSQSFRPWGCGPTNQAYCSPANWDQSWQRRHHADPVLRPCDDIQEVLWECGYYVQPSSNAFLSFREIRLIATLECTNVR